MAKTTELDKDLAEGLKAAKSKRVYFALVMKGSNDGAMIVSKTKVSPTAIAEAKKQSGGSTVVLGFCSYEDGKHVFETAKDAPATAAQAVKTIAKRDAEQTVHAVFRVGSDPELVALDAKPTAGTTESNVGKQTPSKSAGNDAHDGQQDNRAADGLKQRRAVMMEWLKTAKGQPGTAAIVQSSVPIVQQFDQAMKQGDLVAAEKKMVLLENQRNLVPATDTTKPEEPGLDKKVPEGGANEDTTTDAEDNTAKAAELRERRGAIVNWLKTVKGKPGMAAIVQSSALAVQQVDHDLKLNNLGEAEEKLVLLEIQRDLGPSTEEKSKWTDSALDEAVREQEKKEVELKAEIKKLEEQLPKSQYEKLAAEFAGMNVNEIDAALFKQSEEALQAVVASNNGLMKASVEQGENDPAGIARAWQAKLAEAEKKKDEIERKRELLGKMRDTDFWESRGVTTEPPVDEGALQQRLTAAQAELSDTEKSKAFYKKLQQFIGTINSAVAEKPEIGGADVNLAFENAKQQAEAANWQEADKLLVDAHRKAEQVLERKPYLTLKLANEPKINAAKKIKMINPATNNKFGDDIDASWKGILASAKHGDFDFALRDLTELVKTIDERITPTLKTAREKNVENLASLKNQLEGAKNDPARLREIAVAIFKNTGEAEDLGVDAGENARKPFEEGTVGTNVWNVGNCQATFKKYDWFALKKCRKVGTIELEKGKPLTFTDDDMWKLVQFRGKVVNEEIDKLRKIYPTLIAKASGSEDIESDIDITFATPRSGDDVKAAQAFNKVIISRFGKPAGRVFDVNIYPRDYGAIKESFKPDYNVDEIVDVNIDEPEQEDSLKLSKVDQDVATLLKQRRFLEEDQFNEMLQTLLDQSPDEEVRKRVEQQFEEGEDIYLQTSLEKVAKIRAKVNLNKALPDDHAETHRAALNEAITQLDGLKGKGGKDSLKLAQRLVPRILDLFEETYPDESMDVTDALYLEKMGSLRQDQADIRKNQQSIAVLNKAPAAHPGQTCEQAGHNDCDWQANLTAVETKLNALEVKVKKNMFTNIVFANEAIISQGALKHVVEALQAKTIEEKMEKLEKLTAEDLMQSVNEQVADLFKEMKHYDGVVEEAEEAAPENDKQSAKNRANGEGYVHASKYFFRLLDAAISLNLKYPGEETVQAPYEAIRNSGNKTLDQLKKQVDDVLLKLRKSAVIPPEVKGEVGALEMQEIFPQVRDIPSFRTMISDFAIELNKRIRALTQFQQTEEDKNKQQKAQKAYGSVAESDRDKALGHVRALANKPGEGPSDLVATLTGLGVEPTVSAGFSGAWQSAVGVQPPVDLADLQSKLSAIADPEIVDELQAVVRWFEQANAMHALSENQATKAVAAEIKKARIAIENAERVLNQVSKTIDDAKKEKRELPADEKQRLLAEIENAKRPIAGAEQSVQQAIPQGIAESATTMIAETMTDLRRTLENLNRRATLLST